jgi:hypothetical protein
MTASVMIVYVYVPGAYVKLHGPPRATRVGGAGAVGAGGNVGWAGFAWGLFAGVGSATGGMDAHAAMHAVPNMLAIPFSFIITR